MTVTTTLAVCISGLADACQGKSDLRDNKFIGVGFLLKERTVGFGRDREREGTNTNISYWSQTVLKSELH